MSGGIWLGDTENQWGHGMSAREAYFGFLPRLWSTWWGAARMYTRWCDVWNGKPGAAKASAPLHAVLVNALVVAPCHALEDAYVVHLSFGRGWPTFPIEALSSVSDRVAAWVEKRVTWYTWLAADSGAPNEIGFHYRSDLLTRDADGCVDSERRPRMYVFQDAQSRGAAGDATPTSPPPESP